MLHTINFEHIPIDKKLKNKLFNLAIIESLEHDGDTSEDTRENEAIMLFLSALNYYNKNVFNKYDALEQLGSYLNYFYKINLNFNKAIALYTKDNKVK